MPTDHDAYDHTAGRCPKCGGEVFEIEDGVLQTIDADGIMHDACAVNVLIGKDERPSAVSAAFADFALKSAAMFLLLLIGAMFAMAVATPDHVSVKVGNDAGMVRK